MTIEEMLARESIRSTIARYTMAGDRLRTADLVATFADNGVLEATGLSDEDQLRYEGRPAIAAWIDRWRGGASDETPTHAASFVRHHLTTSSIELIDAASARARTYWIAWTDIGPDHAGHYLDDFRCVDGVWLIAYRRVREDWRSPESLFTGAVARTR